MNGSNSEACLDATYLSIKVQFASVKKTKNRSMLEWSVIAATGLGIAVGNATDASKKKTPPPLLKPTTKTASQKSFAKELCRIFNL